MQFLINHHLCHNVLVSQPWPCEAAQSCPTLRDSMDCNLPGSSVHGILQARVLEWVAISFPRRSSQPRDGTPVSCTAGRRFTVWAIWYHRLSENGINGLSKITFINSLKLLLTSQVFNTGFPGGSAVKNLPVVQESRVRSLGQEDPLEKEIENHSSILAWKIPWTEEPGRL